jgi:hypothetical protein
MCSIFYTVLYKYKHTNLLYLYIQLIYSIYLNKSPSEEVYELHIIFSEAFMEETIFFIQV